MDSNSSLTYYQSLLNTTISNSDISNISNIITTSIQDTSLTGKCPLFSDSNQYIVSQGPMINGQLIIGNTNNLPTIGSLIVSNNLTQNVGAGTISLDTIQDIQQSSNVTFNELTLDSLIINYPVLTDSQKKLISSLINLASNVTGILQPWNGGTGINNAFTITLSGNFQTSGAFNLILNLIGNTNITLPVSGSLISTSSGSSVDKNIVIYSGTSGTLIQDSNINLNYIPAKNTLLINPITSSLATGNFNITVGVDSLRNLSTGSDCNSFGYQTLYSNTIGDDNNAFGYRALYTNTDGFANNAFGTLALRFNNGHDNNAFGYDSLTLNTSGNFCSAFGNESLVNNTTGSNNTAYGINSGYSNTTGSSNSFFGSGADCSVNNLTNSCAIGANSVVSTSNSIVLGNNCNVGIGTSSPNYKLHVVGNTDISGNITTATWNGQIISTSYGGTGISTYITGDILFANTLNTLSKLSIGSNTYLLQSNGASPLWVNPATSVTSLNTNNINITDTATTAVYFPTFVDDNIGYKSLLVNSSDYTLTIQGGYSKITIPKLLISLYNGFEIIYGLGSGKLSIQCSNSSSSDTSLVFNTNNSSRILTINGDSTLNDWFNQNVKTTGTPTFSSLTLTNPLGVTNGGTGLSSTTINRILYSSGNNVIGQISTANNGVLITDGTGIPSISSTLPTAVQNNITLLGTIAEKLNINAGAADGCEIIHTGANVGLIVNNSSANNTVFRIKNNSNNFWDIQNNTDNSFSIDYNDTNKLTLNTSGQMTIIPSSTGNILNINPNSDSVGDIFTYVGNTGGTGSAGHTCGYKTGSYNGGEIALISNGDDIAYNAINANTCGIYITNKDFRITNNGGSGSTFSEMIKITNSSTGFCTFKCSTDASSASSGFNGEVFRSQISLGSAITLSNGVWADITSIALTAGDWMVNSIVMLNGSLTGTSFNSGISSTSGNSTSGLTQGDNYISTPTMSTASSDNTLSIPGYRINISSNTTYYLKSMVNFTVGTAKVYGRISARRIR